MRFGWLQGPAVILWTALCCVLCSSDAAHAFWPLTRSAPARPDSISAEQWNERFETWKSRPLFEEPEVVSSSGAASGSTAQASDSRTVISGFGRTSVTTAPAGTTSADDDSTAGSQPSAAADSVAAPRLSGSDLARLAAAQAKADAAADADSLTTQAPDSLAEGASAEADSIATAAEAARQATQEAATRAAAEAAARAADEIGFAPSLDVKLSSTNDEMRLTSSLVNSFSDPSGVLLATTLSYGENIRLTQNTTRETAAIQNTLNFPLASQGMMFNLSTGNNRSNTLGARNADNTRSRTRTDDRSARISAAIGRQLLAGISANAFTARRFSQNSQDIQGTTGANSGAREREVTGNSYGFGLNVNRLDWVKVRGRFGRARESNKDRSPSLISEFNQLGEEESNSEGDTASVNFEIPVSRFVTKLEGSFRVSDGTRSYTDVARTSGGGTGSSTNFALETEAKFSRSFRLNSTVRPLSAVTLNLSYEAARDSTTFELRPNSFSDNRRSNWGVHGTLKYSSKGTLNLNFDSRTNHVNRDELSNPQNPLSRRDEENRITGDITHDFTSTLKTRLSGELRLNQGFYTHAGPQGRSDRDELRTQLTLNVDGRINSKITASAEMYVRTFDQAFIDKRRSANNTAEVEYVVRQNFTYQLTEAISLSQRYGLSSKVLDQVFNPLRNTLNRNHFLQTGWSYNVTSRLTMDGNFDYLLQDNGLFLDTNGTGQRFFVPTVETRKNEIAVGVRYKVLARSLLDFTSRQQSSREWRTSFSGGEKTSVFVSERSNLALGLNSNITLGSLKLNMRVNRNQSFNVSLNRNVFYNMDSSLTYAF